MRSAPGPGPWAAALAVLLPLAPACLGDAPLVGGTCASGFEACGHVCVDPLSDPNHCGGCGVVCSPSLACVAGSCEGPAQADAAARPDSPGVVVPDAGADALADHDGAAEAALDAGDADAAEPHAEAMVEASPESGEGAAEASADAAGDAPAEASPDAQQQEATAPCTGPLDTPQQCGACEIKCEGETPECRPLGDGGFACAPMCEPPLQMCDDTCADVLSDPNHCGSCDHGCLSDLCIAGVCHGATAGHAVLIGMDYQVFNSGAPPTVIFRNAVFLPPHNPLRVRLWSQYASCSQTGCAEKVKLVLQDAAAKLGRAYDLVEASAPDAAVAALTPASVDVLLVPDQPDAPAGALGSVGDSFKQPVADFLQAGGVVVTLLSPAGTGEMHELVTRAGLASIDAVEDVSSPPHALANVAPYDVVGVNVLSPFLARPRTSVLSTKLAQTADTVFVIADAQGQDAGLARPVVIHRVIVP